MTQQLAYSVLNEEQRKRFETTKELDLSFGVPGLSRFRANVFLHRGVTSVAIRQIPYEILTFEQLGLSKVIRDLTMKQKGLVLVTGPTGSGKSTTLAAMIDLINTNRAGHIITVEDPIEYVHHHKKCIVHQREINSDTTTFVTALKYVLRQDPDVILIGEMRDLETIAAALTIAETGHLVLATGDKVCVGGGTRKASKNHPRILNLEFIDVIDLQKNLMKSNPICKKCDKKMKSKGKNQGYQSIKCGKKSENKVVLEVPRKIKKQLYIPSVSAHRQLSRPLQRIGRINNQSKFDESSSWFCVYEN